MEIEVIRDILCSTYPEMEAVTIRHEDLVYEQRVRLKCLHCANYSTKWTCPGRLPEFDFPRLLGEYEHLAVITGKDANRLHEAMLYVEQELFRRNHPMAESFIGGYCQLCEGGCPSEGCAHPERARIPWDATGCNVTRSLANIGLKVDFSGGECYRYGLLVW